MPCVPLRHLSLARNPGATPALLSALATTNRHPLAGLAAALHPAATTAVRTHAARASDKPDPGPGAGAGDVLDAWSPTLGELWDLCGTNDDLVHATSRWALARPEASVERTSDWWSWVVCRATLPPDLAIGAAIRAVRYRRLAPGTLENTIALAVTNPAGGARVADACRGTEDAALLRAAATGATAPPGDLADAARRVTGAPTLLAAQQVLLEAGPNAAPAAERVLARRPSTRVATAIALTPTIPEPVRASALGHLRRGDPRVSHVARGARTADLALAAARVVQASPLTRPLFYLVGGAYRTDLPAGLTGALLAGDLRTGELVALALNPGATPGERAEARTRLAEQHARTPEAVPASVCRTAAAGQHLPEVTAAGADLPWEAFTGVDAMADILTAHALTDLLPAIDTPARAGAFLALADTFTGTVGELVTTAVTVAT